MNDPHVSAIHYRLELGENVEYSPPESPLSFSMGSFDVLIRGQEITLSAREHFATREAARSEADPLIRAWEMETGLRTGLSTLRITCQRTEIIDRAPIPGIVSAYGEAVCSVTAHASAVIVRSLREYPPPLDPEFGITPDVETLWRRYVGYLEGREPLLAMAYFCYTVLTPGLKGRALAAKRLNVDEDVLRKLSELSSIRGDRLSARKADPRLSPLTPEEYHWLDVAVRRLIIQLGKSSTTTPTQPLRLSDLPTL